MEPCGDGLTPLEKQIVDAVQRGKESCQPLNGGQEKHPRLLQARIKESLGELGCQQPGIVSAREWLFDQVWLRVEPRSLENGFPPPKLIAEVEWDDGKDLWKDLRKLYFYESELKVAVIKGGQMAWSDRVRRLKKETAAGLPSRYLAINVDTLEACAWNSVR